MKAMTSRISDPVRFVLPLFKRWPLALDLAFSAAYVVFWVLILVSGRYAFRIDSLPGRILFLYEWKFILACCGVLLVTGTAEIWRCRGPASPFSALRRRMSWMAVIISCMLALVPFFPEAASGILFFGPALVMAWACMALFAVPATVRATAWPERYDAVIILLVATVLYTALGTAFTHACGPHSGDEGHYLVQAKSLRHDRDLDLRNNFTNKEGVNRDYVHISPNARGDKWYSWHSPGLSFLLAPVYARGAVWHHFVLGLIAAFGIAGTYLLGRIFGANRGDALLCTFILGAGAFWCVYASRALPEVLGATLAAYGAIACFAPASRRRHSPVLSVLCVGFLPWVHTRFIPVACLLAGCYGLSVLFARESRRSRVIHLGWFTVGCALVSGGYLAVQWRMFDKGMAYPVPDLLFSYFPALWHSLASSRGILFMLPVFACAQVAALYCLSKRESRTVGALALLLFLGVWLSTCTNRWFTGGACMPGRFLLVITPVMMACLASTLTRCPRAGFRFLCLYLGLLPVTVLVSQLTVLGQFGKSFPDPFLIDKVHPLFSGLPRFHYNPYTAFSMWPAAALYAAALLLLFPRKTVATSIQCLVLLLPVAAYALSAHASPYADTSRYSPSRVAQIMVKLDLENTYIAVMGDTRQALDLLDYSDLFAKGAPGAVRGMTTRPQDASADKGWIATPPVLPGCPDPEAGHWVTVVSPFATGQGHRMLYVEAENTGQADVEWLIREGRHDRISKRFASGVSIRERFHFETENEGEIHVLARFTGREGEMAIHRLAFSPWSPDLLEKANLVVTQPASSVR